MKYGDITTGNVTTVPLNGNIATYITAATAGDTLILAAGTYTITSGLTINKKLHIKGQGEGITTIYNNTALGATPMIAITTEDDSMISDMTISTGAAGSCGALATSTRNAKLSNLQMLNANAVASEADGVFILGAYTIDIENCTYSATGTSNIHIFANSPAATGGTINIRNCKATSSGAATAVYGAILAYATDGTINIYDSYFSSTEDKAGGCLTVEGGTINAYNSVISGAGATAFDVMRITSGTLKLSGCTLVNNKISGTVDFGTNDAWSAWTPTLTWGVADPTNGGNPLSQVNGVVSRYKVSNGVCTFYATITFDDGNNSTGVSIMTLPITPRSRTALAPCGLIEIQNGAFYVAGPALAYISYTNGRYEGATSVVFADTQGGVVMISGFYEV